MYICSKCIGDHIVRKEISDHPRQICMSCGKRRAAMSLEKLAGRVDKVYMEFINFADEDFDFIGESDTVRWIRHGESPVDIISSMLECGDDIAEAIVDYLHENSAWSVAKDGEIDWYDKTSTSYEIQIPFDSTYRENWETFCESIKHERRFFSPTAKQQLDKIFDYVLVGIWPGPTDPVRTIGGTEDDPVYIYRGRQADDVGARRRIYSAPARELGAPPKSIAKTGRMNAAGISAFYGSFEADTCVSELRLPVGAAAVVGKFQIVRPLRVLDMTVLDGNVWAGSPFGKGFIQQNAYVHFLREFHAQIRKPVLPGSETLEYLPTQFIAEYLAGMIDPPIDGIIYSSALTSDPEALNIAIFPHARAVEPDADEHVTFPDFVQIESDHENRQERVTIPALKKSMKIRPKPRRLKRKTAELVFEPIPSVIGTGWDPEPSPPSLRLIRDGIELRHVSAVIYKTTNTRVDIDHEEDLSDPAF